MRTKVCPTSNVSARLVSTECFARMTSTNVRHNLARTVQRAFKLHLDITGLFVLSIYIYIYMYICKNNAECTQKKTLILKVFFCLFLIYIYARTVQNAFKHHLYITIFSQFSIVYKVVFVYIDRKKNLISLLCTHCFKTTILSVIQCKIRL